MNSTKTYDNGIAIAKAFGIIFVVLSHCCAIPWRGGDSVWQDFLCRYVSLFHMPLFYFLSGYFFKFSYIYSKKIFVKKKIDGLWKPYVKWALLFVLLHNVFSFCGLYGDHCGSTPGPYSITDTLYNCGMVLIMRGGDQLIGGFWFIIVLFRSAILALLTLWAVKAVLDLALIYAKELKDKYPLFIKPISWICIVICGNSDGEVNDSSRYELRISFISLAMLSVAAITLMNWQGMPTLGRYLLAAAIFLVGFLTSQITISTGGLWKVGFVVVGLALGLCIPVYYHTQYNTWGAFRMLVFGSISTWTWVIISRAIEQRGGVVSNFLIYVGKNTMIVLALHFLCFKIVNALKIWYYGLSTSQLGTFPLIANDPSGNNVVWFVLYIIVGVGVPIGIKALYDRSRFAGKL